MGAVLERCFVDPDKQLPGPDNDIEGYGFVQVLVLVRNGTHKLENA